MVGEPARDIALGHDADHHIALGPAHILDHQRADIFALHQGNGCRHRLAQPHGEDSGVSLFAQTVVDLGHGTSSWALGCRATSRLGCNPWHGPVPRRPSLAACASGRYWHFLFSIIRCWYTKYVMSIPLRMPFWLSPSATRRGCA